MSHIAQSEEKFYEAIQSGCQKVLLYEDSALLMTVKSIIPEEIMESAKEKYRNLKSTDVSIQDLVLSQLMDWFKGTLFTWTNQPQCPRCSCKQTAFVENGQPTLEEQRWLAARVEIYRCNKCNSLVRFPRYNHPRKLLETLNGRCGEWSNFFTLLCRSLGYEARLVCDWTDHVWTEVFSEHHNRWLHCDPCESRLDCPLLYEAGWGKKLTYVIAYSKEEVQDVTWRYTSKFKETLSRRRECREQWLIEKIFQLTKKLQQHLPQERKDELLKRRLFELVEFLTPRNPKDSELGGRISGSLEWRIRRNEQGQQSSSPNYVFKPHDIEISRKFLHLKYSSSEDTYVRMLDGSVETRGWKTCAFQSNSVFRMVENDWRMTYLARKEGSDEAFIKWAFNFKGHKIRKVLILCESTTFENGSVIWTFNSPTKEAILSGGKEFNTVELGGDEEFTLQAVLKGGRGQVAWQHTQLFRQPLYSDDWPLDIQITLM